MKTAIKMVMVLALIVPVTLLGQQKDKKQRDPAKMEQRLSREADTAAKRLRLDAGQKQQWIEASRIRQNCNETYRLQLQGSTTPEQRKDLHNKMHDCNRQFDRTVTGFLKSDQLVDYIAFKEDIQHHKKRGPKGPNGGRG